MMDKRHLHKTEEHKHKLSLALKGRVPWNKGKTRPPFSAAWCHKLSLAAKRRKTSDKQRLILSIICKNRLREKNPNWLGGVTPFLERLRTSLIYRKWRRAVIARDKVCVMCGDAVKLEADHIRQFSILLMENNITTQEQAEACENLWKISNGRTLCHECHKKTDTYANRSFRRKHAIGPDTNKVG